MRTSFVTIAAAAICAWAAIWAAPAAAQDLPAWRADQACPRESGDRAFCVAFEREAYSALSGVWTTLPAEVRESCLGKVAAFGQNSYRLLDVCLDEELTAMRVEGVRRASRLDDPDPPKPIEIKPEAQPQPTAATPADQPPPAAGAAPAGSDAAATPVVQPPQASEALSTTPPPVVQPPVAGPQPPSEPAPAVGTPAEPPKPQ